MPKRFTFNKRSIHFFKGINAKTTHFFKRINVKQKEGNC